MKITFLGTGHGVPSAERYCQSILVEQEDAAYLVDAGAPVIDILLRMNYDISKIKAVFITHMHGDHFHGLMSFMDVCSWYFKNTSFDIFLPEGFGITYFDRLFSVQDSQRDTNRIRLHSYDAGEVYHEMGIKFSAYPTEHCKAHNQEAYGFLVEGGGKRIYITGDMHQTLEDFPSEIAIQPLDAFITECAHFSSEALFEKLKNCRAKRVMAIHVFPIEKYDRFEHLKSDMPFELVTPNDGDAFEI